MVDSATLFASGLIGQASELGNFHRDIEFTLSAGAPVGAYGLFMELFDNDAVVGNSVPFYVVLNNGLEESLFEAAVGDFAAAAVPEPATLWLGAIGLGGAALYRQRRRSAMLRG